MPIVRETKAERKQTPALQKDDDETSAWLPILIAMNSMNTMPNTRVRGNPGGSHHQSAAMNHNISSILSQLGVHHAACRVQSRLGWSLGTPTSFLLFWGAIDHPRRLL